MRCDTLGKKRVQLVGLINLENPLVPSLHSVISTSVDIITNVRQHKLLNFKCIYFPLQYWFCWHQVYSLSSNVFRENIHIGSYLVLETFGISQKIARCLFLRRLSLLGIRSPRQTMGLWRHLSHIWWWLRWETLTGLQLILPWESWSAVSREANSSISFFSIPNPTILSITREMFAGRMLHLRGSWHGSMTPTRNSVSL